MNEAAVSAPESNIIALFPQKSVENGAELGQKKPRSQSKAEIVIGAKDPESEYAKDWTNVADGIYRYEPSGTLFYHPTNPDGGRTYRSLKTKNLKIAVERYQKLKGTQGNIAESKLKVSDIISKHGRMIIQGKTFRNGATSEFVLHVRASRPDG